MAPLSVLAICQAGRTGVMEDKYRHEMKNDYEYREREQALDTEGQFRFGEGKISAYCSLALGALSLLACLMRHMKKEKSMCYKARSLK